MLIKELEDFLIANKGKPEGMTWFEVAEQFEIHVTEGKYDTELKWKEARADKARKLWNKIKPDPQPLGPYESLKLKSVWEQRTKDGEVKLLHSYSNDPSPEKLQEDIDQVIRKALQNVEPMNITPIQDSNKMLFIPISDIHIGALGGTFMKENSYNAQIVEDRLEKILNRIYCEHQRHGSFDAITIADLGDSLDGYKATTVRGGHILQQNMDDREQFDGYFNAFKKFFDSLVPLNLGNVKFIALSNDNHSGPFSYTAQRALQIYLETKFPNVEVFIAKDFIHTFRYGNHYYHMTHGKDEQYLKKGLPLTINPQTEVYFQRYLDEKGYPSNGFHTIVKGDLHQQCDQRSYKFRYLSCPSFFGGTNYIHTNFGPNQPTVVYDIVEINKKEILKGEILL